MSGAICEFLNKLLEDAAAMFVIFELVKAGAGRREKNDVAGMRGVRSDFYGTLECTRAFDGDAAGDLAFDFLCSRANKQREDCLLAQ